MFESIHTFLEIVRLVENPECTLVGACSASGLAGGEAECERGGGSVANAAAPARRSIPGRIAAAIRRFGHRVCPRLFLGVGVGPIGVALHGDRGQPIHRYYLEQFVREFAGDIRGRCLEFQDATYSSGFGGGRVTELDILHIDDSVPEATLVADLTADNDIPGDRFDCIICTHVLEVVTDPDRFVSELHRLLKPGGVLLLAVPHILYDTTVCGELWRFTPRGLRSLLVKRFREEDIEIRAYGNSLAAAADIRGLAAREFRRKELEISDPRFVIEVCARVVKPVG